MARKWVLDAGCGAGRFLDVVAGTDAEVVGLDISGAIDVARDNLRGHPRVHFVQGSIHALPFRDDMFDGVYCIGVIQHTSDPLAAVRALPRVLRPGGLIAYTIYERRSYTRWHSKYLVRPLTRRLPPGFLLSTIRAAMPILFPISEVAFRAPLVKRLLRAAIPIANYVDERALTVRQRYSWAIMDTFDMLAPRYDQPQTEGAVTGALKDVGVAEIGRRPAAGLSVVGRRITPSGAR